MAETKKFGKHMVTVTETLDEAIKILDRHEKTNNQKFVVYSNSKGFGLENTDLCNRSHKILWQHDFIEYSGTPFIILNKKIYDCHYGKDRSLPGKMRRLASDSLRPYKNPDKLRLTKKHGCSVQLIMLEIAVFPDIKIKSDTKFRRTDSSKRLREAINSNTVENVDRKFVIAIPELDSHTNHPPDEEQKDSGTECTQEEQETTEVNIQPQSEVENEIVIENDSENNPAVRVKKKRKRRITPAKLKTTLNIGPGCRELLKQIGALTFLIEDEWEVIRELHKNLEMIRNFISAYVQQGQLIPCQDTLSTTENTPSSPQNEPTNKSSENDVTNVADINAVENLLNLLQQSSESLPIEDTPLPTANKKRKKAKNR